MQVFHTDHVAFKGLLMMFSEFPKIIPAFSFIVADVKKPIALFCIYHDSGLFFLHGLFKAKNTSKKDLVKAIRFSEKYLDENLFGKFPVLIFTDKPWLKKLGYKNKFKEESASLLIKEPRA